MADAVKDTRDFFATAERILFDVITWVILIPKTLYLVLANPKEIPDYIRKELAAERGNRFEDGISPVFLYLIVALGPFLLTQVVSLPTVPISGPARTTVQEHATFAVPFDSLSRSLTGQIAFEWSVLDQDQFSPVDVVRQCFVAPGYWSTPCDPGATTDVGWGESPGFRRFEQLVRDSAKTADEAREAVAAEYGAEEAQGIFDFWCAPPAYEGCGDAGNIFQDLVEEGGVGVDEARARIASQFGAGQAAEIAAYWCAPPADYGCAESAPGRAWKVFERSLADTSDVEVARARVVAARYDDLIAAAIAEYWCSPPAGRGCGEPAPPFQAFPQPTVEAPAPQEQANLYDRALERFAELIEQNSLSAADARDRIAGDYGGETADQVLAFWCAPPAYAGCETSEASSEDRYDEALTRFGQLVTEESYTARAARDAVAEQYDAALADELLAFWCAPPAYGGCDNETPTCNVIDEPNASSISCAWPKEGTYAVSLEIRDWSDGSRGELLDYSEIHPISVLPAEEDSTTGSAAKKAGKNQSTEDSRNQRQSTDLSALFKDTRTLLLALAFLALPLYWSLIVLLFRAPSLSQASIKPAFYVQCLYLSPIVFAIWIPFLLSSYLPELETSTRLLSLWALLIVVLIGWLFSAQLGYVAKERAVSKRAAVLILAVFSLPPLLLIFVAFQRHVLASSFSISKFDLVESLGFLLVVLMFVPFLTRLVAWSRWRKSPGA